jgi:hypothetical protein
VKIAPSPVRPATPATSATAATPQTPQIDVRRAPDIQPQLAARAAAFLPGWNPAGAAGTGPDAALLWIAARYMETLLTRLNRAPDKNRLAFLDTLGVELIPAQEARVPLVFRLAATATDVPLPAGTQVAAPPPAGSSQQVVFETETDAGLMAAQLRSVVSLWPGRDQAIDHGAALAAGLPIVPWDPLQLADTPHEIYFAHETLLALSGQASVDLQLEIVTPASAPLEIVWEYWDGQVWRVFKDMQPLCGEAAQSVDGTAGLTRSGRIRLAVDCAQTAATAIGGISAHWIRGRLAEPLPVDPARVLPLVSEARLAVRCAQALAPEATGEASALAASAAGAGASSANPAAPPVLRGAAPPAGLLPDQALCGADLLDTSKSFYPLGQSPKPGDAFYFTNAEVFGKPGALVTVGVVHAATPAEQTLFSGSNPLDHELVWEYWNGSAWSELVLTDVQAVAGSTGSSSSSSSLPAPPADLSGSGSFSFRVPDDLAATTVGGQRMPWVRGRLLSGSYGISATVNFTGSNQFTYVIPQPPALASFKLGYSWDYGPYAAEHVLANNDFQVVEVTTEARWAGRSFAPFAPVSGQTPALYLGFDKPLPVAALNVFFDVAEVRGDTVGPRLVWEYWDGIAWSPLAAQDGTSRLRVAGMVTLIGPDDAVAAARFGGTASPAPLYWVRGRLAEDGPPGAPSIAAVDPNAVWASQRQTVTGESLGSALGVPSQALSFRQAPVLAGEQVEVQELAGARAEVEWPVLAQEVLGTGNAAADARMLDTLTAQLAAEGRQTDIVLGALHLVRDSDKQVAEAWVRWAPQPDFLLSGPADRHYVLDRPRGVLQLGDGVHGRVPPPGAAVAARLYQTGGGSHGNVAAGTVAQLLSGIPGVQSVTNPVAAEGGSDAELVSAVAARGPLTLARRGRAVTAADFETLARETSPAVAMARAIPTLDANGRQRPGWITLVVIPRSTDPQPWPSFGLRQQILAAAEAQAAADLGAALHLVVSGPDYLPVDVDATVAALDPDAAGPLEQAALAALAAFLHPLTGGPDGQGWGAGRGVYLSDVAEALGRVPGLDYVEELALLLAGQLRGEFVAIPAGRVVAAGTLRVRVV